MQRLQALGIVHVVVGRAAGDADGGDGAQPQSHAQARCPECGFGLPDGVGGGLQRAAGRCGGGGAGSRGDPGQGGAAGGSEWERMGSSFSPSSVLTPLSRLIAERPPSASILSPSAPSRPPPPSGCRASAESDGACRPAPPGPGTHDTQPGQRRHQSVLPLSRLTGAQARAKAAEPTGRSRWI